MTRDVASFVVEVRVIVGRPCARLRVEPLVGESKVSGESKMSGSPTRFLNLYAFCIQKINQLLQLQTKTFLFFIIARLVTTLIL